MRNLCAVYLCDSIQRGLAVRRFYSSSMSALPPKADMCSAKRNVSYGPKADIHIQRFLNQKRISAGSIRRHKTKLTSAFFRMSAKGQKWTLLYSITSSALSNSERGMVRPSALAVLRLMTNSNFVGCSTGRSAGLAPFSILSTYAAARRN